MANRHSHKKLRLHVRSRMGATGESYQKALHEIRHSRDQLHHPFSGVDLVTAQYFGVPITLATFEAVDPMGHPVIMWVPSSQSVRAGSLPSLPLMMFRLGGVQ